MSSNQTLITGATGYLGRFVTRDLISRGEDLVVLKRRSSSLLGFGDLADHLRFVDIEEADLGALFEQNRFGTIIHCATNYGRDFIDPLSVIEANLLLPLKLLELARQHGVHRFVNTDTILDPRVNHYALAKSQFKEWLRRYSGDLACVNIAFEHFYGPGDNPTKFVTFVVRSLLAEVPELPLTPGEQWRHFVYIEDAATAIQKILEATEPEHSGMYAFEVGAEHPTRLRDMVELAKRLTCAPSTALRFGALPYRPNEVMMPSIDDSLKRATGWYPATPLEEGLRMTIEAERKTHTVKVHGL